MTWDITPSSRTYTLTELGCHAGFPDNVTPLGLVPSYRTSDQSSFPQFVLIHLRPRLSLWSKLPPNVTGSGSSGGSTFGPQKYLRLPRSRWSWVRDRSGSGQPGCGTVVQLIPQAPDTDGELIQGQPGLHRDCPTLREMKRAIVPMWEAGMTRHQTLRDEAGSFYFIHWKTGTTFDTSFNPLFLHPSFDLAPAQGGDRTLGGLGSNSPMPTSLQLLSLVGSRQLCNFQAWRLLQQTQHGVGAGAWIRS